MQRTAQDSVSPRAAAANSLPSRVFWITGLSGAGKTTVGEKLTERLRAAGRAVVFLDGDALRPAIAEDLGHPVGERRRSATRNSRLCRLLSNQGVDVVCATISMFHEVQRWNRENIPGYFEIYLRVPMEEAERRDAKGLYARARRGEAAQVVGIDIAAEEPESPDLVVDNYGVRDATAAVDLIWERLHAGADHIRDKKPPVRFGTKAETLERLAGILNSATVLPQMHFTVGRWRKDSGGVLAELEAAPWSRSPLVVRSSALSEDAETSSEAGKYDSVLGVLSARGSKPWPQWNT